MAITLICGRPGSGKSAHVLAHLQALPRVRRSFVVVPQQITATTERQVIAALGSQGLWQTQVISPQRLCGRILAHAGEDAPFVDAQGQRMLLASAVRGLEGQLTAFAGDAAKPAFAESCLQALRTFKGFSKTPEQILQAAAALPEGLLRARMKDLGLIYQALETQTQQNRPARWDVYDGINRAVALLGQPGHFLSGAAIFIEEWDASQPQMLLLLSALLDACDDAVMTIPLPQGSDDPAPFVAGALLLSEVRKLAPNARQVNLPDPPVQNARQHAARYAFSLHPRPYEGDVEGLRPPQASDTTGLRPHEAADTNGLKPHQVSDANGARLTQAPDSGGVHLHRFPDADAECLGVAHALLEAVQRGWHWRDMAVVCADPAGYQKPLARALAQLNIPFFADQPAPASAHPVVRALLGAASAVAHRLYTPAVIEALKCGIWPMESAAAALLAPGAESEEEAALLAPGVQSEKPTTQSLLNSPWDSPDFHAHYQSAVEAVQNYLAHTGLHGADAWRKPWHLCADQYDLERLNRLRLAFGGSLLALDEACRQGSTRKICDAWLAFWRKGGLDAQATALQKRMKTLTFSAPQAAVLAGQCPQAVAAIYDALAQMAQCMGDCPQDAAGFCALLSAGLAGTTLGSIPPMADQVLVARLGYSLMPRVRGIFLVGCTEAALDESAVTGLLDSRDAAILQKIGCRAAPDDQLLAAGRDAALYRALAGAREVLWVSYPTRAGGSVQRPAALVESLRGLFPSLDVPTTPVYPPQMAAQTVSAATQCLQAGDTQQALAHIQTLAGADPRLLAHLQRRLTPLLTPPTLLPQTARLLLQGRKPTPHAKSPEGTPNAAVGGISSIFPSDSAHPPPFPPESPPPVPLDATQPPPFPPDFAQPPPLFPSDAMQPPLSPPDSLPIYVEALSMQMEASSGQSLPERLSATQLEQFARCAFAHALAHGCAPTEAPTPRPKSNRIGGLLHMAMADYMAGLPARIPAEPDLAALDAALQGAVEREGSPLYTRPEGQHALRRMSRALNLAAHAAHAQLLAGQFEAALREEPFGHGRRLPALPLPGLDVTLEGRIDRVDVLRRPEGDVLRVIDYKSGTDPKFHNQDITDGVQLQLFLYMEALVRGWPKAYGRTAQPAGVFLFPLRQTLAPPPADRLLPYRLRGFFAGDPALIAAQDAALGPKQSSTVLPLRLLKDGTPSSATLLAPEDFDVLLRQCVAKAAQLGTDMLQGRATFTADDARCGRCSMRAACNRKLHEVIR